MTDISPVEFGKMIATMESLRSELAHNRKVTAELTERMEFLESRYALGKWGLGGAVLLVGFALFGVKETLQTLWRVFAG